MARWWEWEIRGHSAGTRIPPKRPSNRDHPAVAGIPSAFRQGTFDCGLLCCCGKPESGLPTGTDGNRIPATSRDIQPTNCLVPELGRDHIGPEKSNDLP